MREIRLAIVSFAACAQHSLLHCTLAYRIVRFHERPAWCFVTMLLKWKLLKQLLSNCLKLSNGVLTENTTGASQKQILTTVTQKYIKRAYSHNTTIRVAIGYDVGTQPQPRVKSRNAKAARPTHRRNCCFRYLS